PWNETLGEADDSRAPTSCLGDRACREIDGVVRCRRHADVREGYAHSRTVVLRFGVADYSTCARRRQRRPWPPSMTSVDTTTRNGMGVSLSPCPVAAMAPATEAPHASGSSNAHRL